MTLESITIAPFEGTKAEWDGAAQALDGSSFCHRAGWRSVMEEVLGHQTWWWVARGSEGDILGALPLVRVKSRIFGDYLVSMPFLSYGGPVGSVDARRALAAHAIQLADELNVDLLELRTRHDLLDSGLTTNARKLTVVKALPETSEELWEKGLRAKVRSQVRRPLKEGMTVRFGPDQLEPFYEVFATAMRDLGTPVLPRRFFEKLRLEFDDDVLFGVVDFKGSPVAAGCGFFGDDEFEITWAGASREYSRLAPNMLLYWGFMEECIRLGSSLFNFGRCSPDSGTHRFKTQWGTDEERLPWLQRSPTGLLSTPNPDSAKFRAATATWRRLPVGVANLIGPRLSRLLP